MPLSDAELDLYFGAPQRAAKTLATHAQEANPDDAARSLSIAKDTGLPSGAVNADLERFESAYRSKLSSDIIHDEPHLQDYINDNPIHAQVSNDDWGNLANLSSAMQRYNPLSAVGGPLAQFVKGFGEGVGSPRTWGDWIYQAPGNERLTGTARLAWQALGLPLELTGRGISGLAEGTRQGTMNLGQSMGMSEAESGRLARDLAGMAEMELTGTGVHVAHGPANAKPLNPLQVLGIQKKPELPPKPPPIQVNFPKAGIYQFLKNGEVPPVGMDATVDRMRVDEAKQHADILKDVSKAYDSSTTAARSEEAMDRFFAMRPGGRVEITSEALEKIYGEEKPAVGDGKLGDMREVVDGYDSAVASGTTVSVPLRDWLKLKPEFRDELVDDLVLSKDGISINQGKELGEAPKAEEPKEEAPKEEKKPEDEGPSGPVLDITAVAGLQRLPWEKVVKEKDIQGVAEESLTKKSMALLEPKMAEEQKAEAALVNRQIERMERQKQTAEWREHEKEVREEVLQTIDSRPDVALDKLLREGFFAGNSLRRKRPKINGDFLTREQRAGINPDFIADGKGYDPDVLANQFGYSSGDAMLRDLADAEEVRRSAGMGHEAWRSAMIEAEVQARMEQKFGSLEGNILQEVNEHIVSPQVMDRLTEELIAAGLLAGTKPVSKGALKTWVHQVFAGTATGTHSVRKYRDAMGRAGRAAETALLSDKYTEFFKEKQRQIIAQQFMKQAIELEKVQDKLKRIVKQYGTVEKDDTRLSPEHRNFIHQILEQSGHDTGWIGDNLANEIGQSKYKSLEEFQKGRYDNGSRMDIAGWLALGEKFDPEKLPVNEFKDFVGSLGDIIADGRGEHEAWANEKAEDFNEAMGKMGEQFQKFKVIKGAGEPKGIIGRALEVPKAVFARAVVIENLLNRIQRDDPHGPFNKYIVFPLARGAAEFFKLDREELPKMINENYAKWQEAGGKLQKKVENDFWINPLTGVPLSMTKENVLAILQYRGEATSWDKLTRGYEVDPDAASYWLLTHSEKHDWEWAQGQGKIWEHLKDMDDAKRRDRGFTPVQGLQLNPIYAHGKTFEGWYQPIIPHPDFLLPRSKMLEALKAGQDIKPEVAPGGIGLFDNNYQRAGILRRWDMKRTDDARPVSLSIADNAIRMGKQARDIAFRDSLSQAAKFFYDSRFKTEITRRFGPEWSALLEPYLKTITNQDNVDTKNADKLGRAMDTARSALVTYEIGFNPLTFGKHVPSLAVNSIFQSGLKEYGSALKSLITGEYDWKFVNENSAEIRNRTTGHYAETITGAQKEGWQKKSMMDVVADLSTRPLAIGDVIFSRPMWLADYKRAVAEMPDKANMTPEQIHQAAVDIAERGVRQSHGSMMITAKPEMISRSTALGRWFTSFYGVYSHFLQRGLFEIPWRIADTMGWRFVGQLKDAEGSAKKIAALALSYYVMPVVIEMAVEGELRDLMGAENKTPLIYRGMQSAFTHLAGMVPGLRDVAHSAVKGGEPSFGLFSAEYKALGELIADWRRGNKSLEGVNAVKTVAHATEAIGTLRGIPTAHMVKTGEFLTNYMEGREHPKGINPLVPGTFGWGVIHGTAKPRKERK